MGFDIFDKQGYSVDWMVAVAAGKIPGFSLLDKFGRNQAAGTIRVPMWYGGNVAYTFQTVPQGCRMASPDNTATQAMELEFLDANYGTTVVNATLTGTTPVSLGTFLRFNRGYTVEPGRVTGNLLDRVEIFGSGAVAGGTPSVAAMRMGIVPIPFNQTEQAIFTVPANQNLILLGAYSGINSSSGVSAVGMDTEIWVGNFNRPMRNKRTYGMTNLGNNPGVVPQGVPLFIAAKSDIELRVICDATGLNVGGGFYGVLADV